MKALSKGFSGPKCELVLSGFPEGTTSNQVKAHLAQNVVQTPKRVSGQEKGFFKVAYDSEE